MPGYAGSVSATLERLRPDIFMSHFLRDILRQPDELQRTLDHLLGAGRGALGAAVAAARAARHVYLTGIGGSWDAGLNVSASFQLGARPAELVCAAGFGRFHAVAAGGLLGWGSCGRRRAGSGACT